MTTEATDCATGGGVQTITFTSAGTATTDKGGVTTITSTAKGGMTASAPLAKQVDDLDLTITWTITIDGGTAQNAGTSTNKVYVTLADPRTQGMTLYQTVLDVGCRNAIGKTTTADVLAGIWSDFTDLNVVRADGVQMKYWVDRHSPLVRLVEARCRSLPAMINPQHPGLPPELDGVGTCGAWAELLNDVILGQGIPNSAVSDITMVPTDIATDHGKESLKAIGFIIKPLLSGQGNPAPVNTFTDHAVVKYGGKMINGHIVGASIYDPSCGISYPPNGQPVIPKQPDAAELAWEDASVDTFVYVDRAGAIKQKPNVPAQQKRCHAIYYFISHNGVSPVMGSVPHIVMGSVPHIDIFPILW